MSEVHAAEIHSAPPTVEPTTAEPVGPVVRPEEVFESKGEIEDTDIQISLYEEKVGNPYAMDFFKVKDNFFLKLDVEKATQVKTVDDFILSHMKTKGLDDNKEVYDGILNKILETLDLDKSHKSIEKVYKFILLSNFLR